MGLFGKKDQAKEYTDIVHVVGCQSQKIVNAKLCLKLRKW